MYEIKCKQLTQVFKEVRPIMATSSRCVESLFILVRFNNSYNEVFQLIVREIKAMCLGYGLCLMCLMISNEHMNSLFIGVIH